jgi:hypothetical protein
LLVAIEVFIQDWKLMAAEDPLASFETLKSALKDCFLESRLKKAHDRRELGRQTITQSLVSHAQAA